MLWPSILRFSPVDSASFLKGIPRCFPTHTHLCPLCCVARNVATKDHHVCGFWASFLMYSRCNMHGLELCLHSSAPGVSRSSPLTLSFRCPVKGCASDVVLLSPHEVSNPSPPPSHDERVAVDWRWCQAKGCAGFSWGSLCEKLPAWWCCSLSSCGIQSFIVGWKSHSFCRSSTWSWCCTVRTSTRCWDGSWCHSLLLHHALLLCPVKWTLQLLAGLLLSLGLVKDWTRSAASLLSSLCWSLDQLAVRKCWVRSSFPARVGVYGRPRLNHMQNLSPPALRRESIWCPETDLLLCASLTSQWSCCRASPTLHSLFWRQTSLQSWFRCCLLYMWSCCSSFWWCR